MRSNSRCVHAGREFTFASTEPWVAYADESIRDAGPPATIASRGCTSRGPVTSTRSNTDEGVIGACVDGHPSRVSGRYLHGGGSHRIGDHVCHIPQPR